jgi:hypothetical protein
VDPRAGLDDVEMRKFLTPAGLNSDPSVVQPVVSRYPGHVESKQQKIQFVIYECLTMTMSCHVNRVTCMCDYRRGFGLEIGFIDHLHVVTTNDC